MLASPYETSAGSHINITKLMETLRTFLVHNDVKTLNYEFVPVGNINLVFITGKDDAERDLPLFYQPTLVEHADKRKYLFTDLRMVVNKRVTEDFADLSPVVSNIPNYKFIIVKTLYTAALMSGEDGVIDILRDQLALAFGYWISKSIKIGYNLGLDSELRIMVVAMYYYLYMTSDTDEIEASALYFKISKLFPQSGKDKDVENVLKDTELKPISFDNLVSNMKSVINTGELSTMGINTVVNILSNSWFGYQQQENIMMATDHAPTFIAMIYTAYNDKAYKNSRLANVLMSQKRNIKMDDFIKRVDLFVKDNLINPDMKFI